MGLGTHVVLGSGTPPPCRLQVVPTFNIFHPAEGLLDIGKGRRSRSGGFPDIITAPVLKEGPHCASLGKVVLCSD